MSWFEPSRTTAAEQYQRRSFVLLLLFAGTLLLLRFLKQERMQVGYIAEPLLFSVAALCVLPLLGVAVVLGIYLRQEQDEFQRDIEIRGLLAGTAALLMLAVFFSVLHELGWKGYVDPVGQVMTFGLVNGTVKLGYRFRARVEDD